MLSGYSYRIQYKAGKEHTNADDLADYRSQMPQKQYPDLQRQSS